MRSVARREERAVLTSVQPEGLRVARWELTEVTISSGVKEMPEKGLGGRRTNGEKSRARRSSQLGRCTEATKQ